VLNSVAVPGAAGYVAVGPSVDGVALTDFAGITFPSLSALADAFTFGTLSEQASSLLVRGVAVVQTLSWIAALEALEGFLTRAGTRSGVTDTVLFTGAVIRANYEFAGVSGVRFVADTRSSVDVARSVAVAIVRANNLGTIFAIKVGITVTYTFRANTAARTVVHTGILIYFLVGIPFGSTIFATFTGETRETNAKTCTTKPVGVAIVVA